MDLLEGPDLGNCTELFRSEKGKERRRKKKAGIKPTTSQVFAPEACAHHPLRQLKLKKVQHLKEIVLSHNNVFHLNKARLWLNW